MRKFKNKKGFTIVELVVVIAVIGVLTAILVPTFVTLSKRAQVANMQSFVTNINKKLAMNASTQGKNATMHDAQLDAKEIGFDIEKITPFDGHDIVWDSDSDRFMLVKGDEIVLKDNSTELNSLTAKTKKKLFKVAKDANELSDGYSHYLAKNEKWESSLNGGTEKVKFEAGVDVGDNEGISEINYERPSESEGQEVIIRTNGGNLTIDATSDAFRHYGSSQVVTLKAVDTNSYYENGSSDQINIKKGRLILTNSKETSVGTVYLQATGDTYDNIILATQSGAELPNLIARDSVPLPTGDNTKTVVTIQTNVNDEGKQPQKVETINLYSTKGETGNDVYEATSGYNVTDLALLVVEASSTTAKNQAAEQISDPTVVNQISEAKTAYEVTNESELNDALDTKAKYIIIKNSFSCANKIEVTYDVIMEGAKLENDYPVITSSANRILWVKVSNTDLTLRNINFTGNGTSTERGIQVNENIVDCKLSLDGVKVSGVTHYAINFCDNTSGIFNANRCEFSGYNALNIWGFSHKINISNSKLIGTNNAAENPWNNFATICFEADTTKSSDLYSAGNVVTINNSTIIGRETNANKQAIVSFNAGTIGTLSNTLNLNGCVLEADTYRVLPGGPNAGNKLVIDGENIDIENSVYNTHITDVDVSGVTFNSNTATGTVIIAIDGQQKSYNLSEATASAWDLRSSYGANYYGTDYFFYYTKGNIVYMLDFDVSPVYGEANFGLSLQCDGIK